jgi:putative flippase GtrA/SAM-dependent methyltransferase
MDVIALIPAYNPPENFSEFICKLASKGLRGIVVVDDGSDEAFRIQFERISAIAGVHILRHGVNLGKGAALKTGLNYIYCHFRSSTGIVTADADGQHLIPDILEVGQRLVENPEALIIGVRDFGMSVPFRSKLGNIISRFLFRLLVGKRLRDTQSGLRGIPMDLIPKLLKVEANGYEFELDMLLACKHGNRVIEQQEIRTVYLEGNRSSHFNPILDSFKIYFVLFRFLTASAVTALADYFVFFFLTAFGMSILVSQFSARLIALLINYTLVKKAVFYSDQRHQEVFPRYVLLVLVAGSVSYILILFLVNTFSMNVIMAKFISEMVIYVGNFAVQRDLIFTTHRHRKEKTDWDAYYAKPYKTASYTRKITEKRLMRLMETYGIGPGARIAELGGANSCFFDAIRQRIKPSFYAIIDNNEVGLSAFRQRIGIDPVVAIKQEDVLNLDSHLQVDMAFSVGLVEHFSKEGTRMAVGSHFQLLRPGGIAILSFPTPSFLYWGTRFVSEMLGMWIFHDERPLKMGELLEDVKGVGTIIHHEMNWAIFLTQMLLVVRKNHLKR